MDNLRYRWEEVHDVDPKALGLLAHVAVVRIHPFVDGNGRATRLSSPRWTLDPQRPGPEGPVVAEAARMPWDRQGSLTEEPETGNNPRIEELYDLDPKHTVLLGVDFRRGSASTPGSTPPARLPL